MQNTQGCLLSLSLAFLAPFGACIGFSSAGEQKPAAKAKPPGKDSFGDPLPDGVLYRLGTVRLRHEHTSTLIFSADGSHLLSQGFTPDLRVWDVVTGRILQQFAEAPQGRTHLIASPDDRFLACIRGNSYQPLLLDKATGKELARWKEDINCLTLAFSKDGKELVALARENTIVKWGIAERKELTRIKLDMTNVDVKDFGTHCWHLSPDGGTAAFMADVATGERAVPWHFWDTATGKQRRPPLATKLAPDQVSWSPDGGLIAVVARDNTVTVWDMVTGKRLPLEAGRRQAEGSSYTSRGAAFHPKGKLLAVAIDGSVGVWDVDAGKRLWGKAMSGDILVFSPDGKTLAVGRSGIITFVETATGAPTGFSRRDPGWINLAHGWWDNSPCFSRHGRSLMVHDEAGLSELETATGKRLRTFFSSKDGWCYGGLCGDGTRLACVGDDLHHKAHVFMYDAATGKELWRRPKQPMAIHFAADGKKVAVLSWKEDEFTLLDAATGREIQKLPTPSYRRDSNNLKAVSDDLRLAASTKYNWPNVELWDLATSKIVRSLACPPEWYNGSLSFVPGSRLIVGVPDERIRHKETGHKEKGERTRVWDVATGRIVGRFDELLLKMSADGRWLVLEDDKGLRVIRHLHTGRLAATLGGVEPLAFSPDGSLLAVRGESWHEVGLWDTFTGRQVCRYVEPLSEFHWAEFSPDGRTLVLTFRDGGSMLVCDVTGQATEPGKIPPQDLTPAEADRYWLELTSDDGPRSRRARWRLVAGGEHTVKMLQRHLRRVEPLDGKQLAALIAALDSGSFAERQKSMRVLEKMEFARPALAEALTRNPSLEMNRRIEMILATHDALPLDMESGRALRGVLLLEQIATPPARQLLQTLANGAAGSLLTQEALAALQRLALAEKVH